MLAPVIELPRTPRVLEFFAGIGLARAGLEAGGCRVVWANDIDPKKRAVYALQYGAEHYALADVHDLDGARLPDAEIAWASSPCTDLSLAGARQGLAGSASSSFYGFTAALDQMEDRKPAVAILENVTGLASSHGGDDLRAAIREFNRLGYSADVIILDSRRWLPQSRPRLFILGLQEPGADGWADTALRPDSVAWVHSEEGLVTHVTPLPSPPMPVEGGLTMLAEQIAPEDPRWWNPERTHAFVSSMSPVQHERLRALEAGSEVVARAAYRRTRSGRATWEMRSDDIAGCLRTARGGSSKQAIAFVGDGTLRVRWMTGREYASLMGASHFDLTGLRESQIYFGFGDAVAVPAVKWLADYLIAPMMIAPTALTGAGPRFERREKLRA
ncbi:MAG: DNA cytosine methyltransferase [Leucobacter sp.]